MLQRHLGPIMYLASVRPAGLAHAAAAQTAVLSLGDCLYHLLHCHETTTTGHHSRTAWAQQLDMQHSSDLGERLLQISTLVTSDSGVNSSISSSSSSCRHNQAPFYQLGQITATVQSAQCHSLQLQLHCGQGQLLQWRSCHGLHPTPSFACWLVGGQAWRGLQHSRPPAPSKRSATAAKPKPEVKKPQLRRNREITAARLMVVFPDGEKQEMSAASAREAAAVQGLDLVEVNPRGEPPVARIMDWGKFMHEQQKKADAADKARRQAQKLATPKEMQFSARIADHDLEVKLKKVAEWLEQGYRAQLVVKHGREEEAAANEAIDYLLARIQTDFNVEAGGKQAQRRAVSMLVKPLGAPGEAKRI